MSEHDGIKFVYANMARDIEMDRGVPASLRNYSAIGSSPISYEHTVFIHQSLATALSAALMENEEVSVLVLEDNGLGATLWERTFFFQKKRRLPFDNFVEAALSIVSASGDCNVHVVINNDIIEKMVRENPHASIIDYEDEVGILYTEDEFLSPLPIPGETRIDFAVSDDFEVGNRYPAGSLVSISLTQKNEGEGPGDIVASFPHIQGAEEVVVARYDNIVSDNDCVMDGVIKNGEVLALDGWEVKITSSICTSERGRRITIFGPNEFFSIFERLRTP